MLRSPSARKVWIEMVLPNLFFVISCSSPSARKVWIEISNNIRWASLIRSPSARKVWIEIYPHYLGDNAKGCHLPQGRCGLKLKCISLKRNMYSHLPQGRCGLK